VELRASKKGDKSVVYGHAAIFSVASMLIDGAFREIIDPEAFDDVLSRKPDTKFLLNHDVNLLLGRTLSGTLRFARTTRASRLRPTCRIPSWVAKSPRAFGAATGISAVLRSLVVTMTGVTPRRFP